MPDPPLRRHPRHLQLVYAGQVFTNYRWGQLLLEAGFLAIFLSAGIQLIIFLFRFLAFRFLVLARATKLLSGDPSCRMFSFMPERPRLSSPSSSWSF